MVEKTDIAGGATPQKQQYPSPSPDPLPPKGNSFYDKLNRDKLAKVEETPISVLGGGTSQPTRQYPPDPPPLPSKENSFHEKWKRNSFHDKWNRESSLRVKLEKNKIAAFLDAGLDSLGRIDEIAKVKTACKYLESVSQFGLINQQQMDVIRNVYFNLDKWLSEYSKSSEILKRCSKLKLIQDNQQAEAYAKLNDISDIQASDGSIKLELRDAEAQLLDLENQVLEFKKIIADCKIRLASTQSQILKLYLDVQAMQMNAIKAGAEREFLADEVKKAKRNRRQLEEHWQTMSSVLGH